SAMAAVASAMAPANAKPARPERMRVERIATSCKQVRWAPPLTNTLVPETFPGDRKPVSTVQEHALRVLPFRLQVHRTAMARVSLTDEKDHPELADLIATIKKARRGELLNLYRILLHSPALAQAWMEFNNAARWTSELDGRLREIATIRIGHLCRADYIVQQH